MLLMAIITAQVIGAACEGALSDSSCHDMGISRLKDIQTDPL